MDWFRVEQVATNSLTLNALRKMPAVNIQQASYVNK